MDEEKRRMGLMIGLGTLVALMLAVVVLTSGMIDFSNFERQMAATKLPDEDPEYLAYLSRQYEKEGNRAFALAMARRAVIVAPKSETARKQLAFIHIQDKDFASAEEDLREATKLDPDDINNRLALALSLERQHKAAEARAIYTNLFKDPKSSLVQKNEAHAGMVRLAPLKNSAALPPVVR